MTITGIISAIVIGAIIGLLGRLVVPGKAAWRRPGAAVVVTELIYGDRRGAEAAGQDEDGRRSWAVDDLQGCVAAGSWGCTGWSAAR